MVFFSNKRALKNRRHRERGYILLTMMLAVALLMIAATAAITPIVFEIKREREEEMIHRGVQYTRAIRAYYKKFGRYPTRLEDLDNTNNLRYLRKHYKDPLNKNQDFKLLHFGDPDVKMSGTIGGGTIPGATAVGAPGLNGSGSSPSAFGGGNSAFGGNSSSFGNSGSSSSSFGGGSGSGNSGVNSNGIFASSFGNSNNSNSNSATGPNSQNNSNSTTPNSSDPTQSGQTVANGTGNDASSSGQQVIASGPILGVASLNKDTTIREFNKKKKYNEWQFIYDPTADRGGLITTPYQPALQSFANPGQPGQNGTQAGSTSGSPFGNSSGSSFGGSSGSSSGQSSSFGNSSNSFGGSAPSQPPSGSAPPQ
jgi:type II secretory pathway pseudopilin PulG